MKFTNGIRKTVKTVTVLFVRPDFQRPSPMNFVTLALATVLDEVICFMHHDVLTCAQFLLGMSCKVAH